MVGSFLGGVGGGAVVNIVIRAVDNYSKDFNKVTTSIKKQESAFSRFKNSAALMGLTYAALAGAAIAFGVKAVKAALDSERAMQQFDLALGDLADTMIKDLKKASNGLVSDFNLIDNANKAMALGISKNSLVPLMKVAAARSKVFGRTVTEAFNDISIGIGRQSRMILDNLGIILDLDKTYEDYAETLGKNATALSESEKKQALVNAIIEDTKPLLVAQSFLIETNTEKLQRLSAGWDNLKDKVGAWILTQHDSISVGRQQEEQFKRIVDSSLDVEDGYEQTATAVKNLQDEIKGAADRSKELLNSLKDISSIVLVGESTKNIEIAEKEAQINKKKLEIAELEQGAISETLGKKDSFMGAYNKQQKEIIGVENELSNLQDDLEILRLQRDVEFTDVKNLEQAKAEAFANEQTGIEQTVNDFLQGQENKKQSYFDEQETIKKLDKNFADLKEAILDSGLVTQEVWEKIKDPVYVAEEDAIESLIKKTNDLTDAYIKAGEAREGAFVKVSKIQGIAGVLSNVLPKIYDPKITGIRKIIGIRDAIIRPNGDIIKPHPQDTLIATKNPEGLGGNGITFIVQGNLIGLDEADISRRLASELNTKLSL